jgi:hypothetical protein
MRTKRNYGELLRHYFRADLRDCPTCATRLQRYCTIAQRTIITATGPLFVTHIGYRCPEPACPGHACCFRSAAADALALPGFTFGLDIVIRAGQLHWGEHQTLDQVHQALSNQLAPWGLSISRREVLYLADAYATLLRINHQPVNDPDWAAWRAQVEQNGGLIISIDGIQPDKGNETVYLVRDVLTGRVLAADNVRVSSTVVIKEVLAPVVALHLPIKGAISDAQESLLEAVAELWPGTPHQLCHFHYLREASRLMYEADRAVKVALRKQIHQRTRDLRQQLATPPTRGQPADEAETAQLGVLADYALAVQTAANLDGTQPFNYGALAVDEALGTIATSLEELEKGGPAAVGDVRPSWLG